MFYQQDTDIEIIRNRKVCIVGYGSQGHAHAQNLRDSGCQVIVAEVPGDNWQQAEKDGFKVVEVEEGSKWANLVMILAPDTMQGEIFHKSIAPNMDSGDALCFAHGFNIHFGYIEPPREIDVFMVAPKGPGHLLRRTFLEKWGVPALVAVAQDFSGQVMKLALSYTAALGSARVGVLETTFEEETVTDLFGEQTVLCGGLTHLITAAFETLVEAGYKPEVAYFECLHEVKLITDLIQAGGISSMRYSISDTAEWGDYVSGPKVITKETRAGMKEILGEIQNGKFASNWMEEYKNGLKDFHQMREKGQKHPLEETGARLRKLMKIEKLT